MATQRPRGKSLPQPQRDLAIRVFAELMTRYRTATELAEALNTDGSVISHARKGGASLGILVEACKLAGTPTADMAAAGIPVAGAGCTRDEALRMLAAEEGITGKSWEHFLRVRGNLGMGAMTMLEALKMLQVIQETGKTIEGEANAAAVDNLFAEKPKKRR